MFKSTINLFDQLYAKLDKENAPGFNRDLAIEARKRLQQLDYLYSRAREIDTKQQTIRDQVGDRLRDYMRAMRDQGKEAEEFPERIKVKSEEFDGMRAGDFEMELFTEAFYLFAFRLR